MRVGFIGAGRMGAPMVRRLAEAGHQVRALGRTEEKRGAVVELGAVTGHPMPLCESVLALVRQRAREAGCYA